MTKMLAHVMGEPVEGMDVAYQRGRELTARTFPSILDFDSAKQHALAAYADAPDAERGFSEGTYMLVYLQGWSDAEEEMHERRRQRRRRVFWRQRHAR